MVPKVPGHVLKADTIASRLNDAVSFKKEVVNGSFHSLIPVVMQETGAGLDEAVRSLIKSLATIGDSLDSAVDALIANTGNDNELKTAVEKYVAGFRTNMTGNYWWS